MHCAQHGLLIAAEAACLPAAPEAEPSALPPPAPHAASAGDWDAAHNMRTSLLSYIRHAAGVATLLDVRRCVGWVGGGGQRGASSEGPPGPQPEHLPSPSTRVSARVNNIFLCTHTCVQI